MIRNTQNLWIAVERSILQYCLGEYILKFASLSNKEKSKMKTPSPIEGITFRFIESNGLRLRVAEAGESGPLVLLAHGWPESWYSWRHQITFLAEAGYRVAAPDMRGYGESDKPTHVEDYNITELAADLVGVIDAFGEEKAILVGHDWGAIVAWSTVLLHPNRFSALVAMSVPYSGRPTQSPMELWREKFGDLFFYILYHNEPNGIAEKEYDGDPRALISRLYLSPNSPREAPIITDPNRSAGGWIERLGAAKGLPDWLTQKDLDYTVQQFEKAGFRGGINYYRNFHRNWELTAHLQDVKIKIPTLFIAGEQDMVIAGTTQEILTAGIKKAVNDLRGVKLIPNKGHWIQQEAPSETNSAILHFLDSL